jgi:hypothetical protein
MLPHVNLDATDRIAETPPALPPTLAVAPAVRHEMTEAERQGMAMGWIGMALGIFILLGGLSLWAAAALNAGFAGWLVGIAVLGLGMALVTIAVGYFVLRPRR